MVFFPIYFTFPVVAPAHRSSLSLQWVGFALVNRPSGSGADLSWAGVFPSICFPPALMAIVFSLVWVFLFPPSTRAPRERVAKYLGLGVPAV